MRFSDAPTLGGINHGAALQSEAVKLQSYASLDFSRGGTYGVDVVAPFWRDQLTRMAYTHGHPSDGLYLGSGKRDIRKQCYKVQSAVRMSSSAESKALLAEFIQLFIDSALSLNVEAAAVVQADKPTSRNGVES